MGFFDLFRNKKPDQAKGTYPKAMEPIFERESCILHGQRITNDAISHKALGNAEKAIALLDSAISQYGYAPAMTIKAKMLIAEDRDLEAIQWLNKCIVRIEANTEGNFGWFPVGVLMGEMCEQLGVIYFESYGNFARAIEYFQKALNVPVHGLPRPELYRASIYEKLAQVYAMEGLPEDAIMYCKKRQEINAESEPCKQVLKLMEGFERRPHNLQAVIDGLMAKLVLLRHPVAMQTPEPLPTDAVYASVVPIAVAWICMQHARKSNNFLSGAEVCLLAQAAGLIRTGSFLLGQEQFMAHVRIMQPQIASLGWGIGDKKKRVLEEHDESLRDVMSSIPVDDLFRNNENARNALATWASKALALSEEQSRELVKSLNSV